MSHIQNGGGGGGSTSLVVNSTPISGGAANQILYDNGGILEEAVIGNGLSLNGGVLSSGLPAAPSNMTWYVSSSGSDSNPGTIGSPFATLQHAINVAAGYNYQSLYTWTINIAAGTYLSTGNIAVLPSFVNLQPNSTQTIEGVTGAPGTVILKGAGDLVVQNADAVNNQVFIDGVTLYQTASFHRYFNVLGGSILYGNVTLDADAALTHIAIWSVGTTGLGGTNAFVDTPGSVTFTLAANAANFFYFLLAAPNSQSNYNATQFTLPVATTVHQAWVNGQYAQVNWSGNTFTNLAGVTGNRAQIQQFTTLITDNGVITDLPGNANGTIDGTCWIKDNTSNAIGISAVQKSGVPVAGDLPASTWKIVKDTSGGDVYLAYNDGGTIRYITIGSYYNYQQPTTGFSITLGNTDNQVILDPAGTLATGTIVMPAAPQQDGLQITIRSSQPITALTVSPNSGQTLANGAPTTLAAGAFFTVIWKASTSTWYFGVPMDSSSGTAVFWGAF